MSIKSVKNFGSRPGSRPYVLKFAIDRGLSFAQLIVDSTVVPKYTVSGKLMLTWVKADWKKLTGQVEVESESATKILAADEEIVDLYGSEIVTKTRETVELYGSVVGV